MIFYWTMFCCLIAVLTRDLKTEIESLLKQAIRMENSPSKRLEVYQVIQQELLKEKPNSIILESLVLLLESNVRENTLYKKTN